MGPEIAAALCILLAATIIGGLMVIAFVFAIISVVRGQRGKPMFGGKSLRAWIQSGNLIVAGTPARGIVLAVAPTGTRTSYYGQRCEMRGARVDVEIPGIMPYEIQTTLYIPTNLVRDVLPGSTMELRVDRTSASKAYVVGPDVGYAQGAVRTA